MEPRIVQIVKNQHPSFELFYEYRLSAAAGPSPEDTQTETHGDVCLPVSKTTPLSEMNTLFIFFFLLLDDRGLRGKFQPEEWLT